MQGASADLNRQPETRSSMRTLTLDEAAAVLKTHPDTVADCIAHRGLPAAELPELIDTAWIAQRIACRRDYVTPET